MKSMERLKSFGKLLPNIEMSGLRADSSCAIDQLVQIRIIPLLFLDREIYRDLITGINRMLLVFRLSLAPNLLSQKPRILTTESSVKETE